MQHYDIIIIGGGAAGLMAAYGAKTSRKDVSVLVLEKCHVQAGNHDYRQGTLQLHQP